MIGSSILNIMAITAGVKPMPIKSTTIATAAKLGTA